MMSVTSAGLKRSSTSLSDGAVHETVLASSPGSDGWSRNVAAPPSALAPWQRAHSRLRTSLGGTVPATAKRRRPRLIESWRKSLFIFVCRVGSSSQ